MSKSAKEQGQERIEIQELNKKIIKVPIRGVTGLITHRKSERTVESIANKQLGKARQALGPREPDRDFRESVYLMPGSTWEDKPRPRFGFPAIGFKKSMVTTANDANIQQTLAMRAFHVLGDDNSDLVELSFNEIRMREDMAPNSGRGSGMDLRYRAEFVEWSVLLTIRYNASIITAEQLVNLINLAGFGVGVGDWRVKSKSSTGTFGMYEVDTARMGKTTKAA